MSILHITKNAGKQLIRIANENKMKNILFYVKGGGCNGFNYKLKPTNNLPDKLDEVVKYEQINIIIDSTSVFHLLGTTIDWKKDIMGESFHFENPNASAKCGCGTSFSI
jgi:iron-sulfur cluster assembly accessory protein